MAYWERAFEETEERVDQGEYSAEQAEAYLLRGRAELAARRLEHQAALIRYTGDPAFFRSPFHSIILWLLAGISSAYGTITLLEKDRQEGVAGEPGSMTRGTSSDEL